jgi:CHAT domain-containing protein/tetratricopeptide (TPR) repeat protein
VDVRLVLSDSKGRVLFESDHPNGASNDEQASWIADGDADLSLEVRSVQKSSLPGPYRIRLATLRDASPDDPRRLAAARALADGERLSQEDSADSQPLARKRFEEALTIFRSLGDRSSEASALCDQGELLSEHGQSKESLGILQQSLAIQTDLASPRGQAESLTRIGEVLDHLGQTAKAIEHLQRAVKLWQNSGYRGGEALALADIGDIDSVSDERQKALDYYSLAIPIARSLGEKRIEASCLTGIGQVYVFFGEFEKALDSTAQSLALVHELGERRGEAVVLNNLSIIHNLLGEHEQALEALTRALPLRRAVGDKRGEAYTLTSLGRTCDHLGRNDEALDYYRQALELRRAVGDRRGEVTTLNLRSLLLIKMGRPDEALADLRQALEVESSTRDTFNEAETLRNFGIIQASKHETSKALETLQQSLDGYRAVGDTQRQSEVLYNIASFEAEAGSLVAARTHLEQSLELMESMRSGLMSPERRADLLATAQDAFELAVELDMRSHESTPGHGFDAAAFEASERARARSMVDLLGEAHATIREGVDPALLEQEAALERALVSKQEKRMRLLGAPHTEEQAAASNSEVQAAKAALEDTEAKIRKSSPRYASLMQPAPLTVADLQKQLDDDTVLLEYSLGKTRSFLWTVTPESLRTYVLPSGGKIEASARGLYELLTARNRRENGESEPQRLARIRRSDADLSAALRGASEMLLGPARTELTGKRLIVVSDRALLYLPFACLPEPGAEANRSTPLIQRHEVVNLPSASVLAALRSGLADRPAPSKTIAVLADPVFDRNDERVSGSPKTGRGATTLAASRDAQTRDLLRSAADTNTGSGEAGIPRLPFTRREARAILALAPPGSRREALDFDASLAVATGGTLADYRFVHFATHGFLDSVHPELSGIVLSLVDKSGKPVPGFLSAGEVFNLRLPADLVVLSGCRTALGKEVRGEGLVGLTRGFFYAGAARVMASLWGVDDVATQELMTHLYQAMLGPRSLSPAEALRRAQLEMASEERWKSPYYWAGFVLQGEWK